MLFVSLRTLCCPEVYPQILAEDQLDDDSLQTIHARGLTLARELFQERNRPSSVDFHRQRRKHQFICSGRFYERFGNPNQGQR